MDMSDDLGAFESSLNSGIHTWITRMNGYCETNKVLVVALS